VRRPTQFLLDENLPPKAAELLALFGYPFLAVGGPAEVPRGSSDADIARWCGANGVVWVTLDRGFLKNAEIARAVETGGTSVLLMRSKGVTVRDHLWFLVCRFDRLLQRVEGTRQRGRPFRARVRKRGAIEDIPR
jgi:predicted nuclease of predicted toxin-antitoxin system